MKHLLHTALLLASFASALADTPAKIAEDYRKQAASALAKVNGMLEKASTTLISQLVQQGATADAEQLTTQLKAKLAGEPVPTPHASATLLFAQYDQARTKALEPVQKASFARIDSMLKGAGASKLETVTELGKVRAEIEAGYLAAAFDWKKTWTLHYRTKDSPPSGKAVFNADGSASYTPNVGSKTLGKWKPANQANSIQVDFLPIDEWLVTSTETGVQVHNKNGPSLIFLVPME